MVKDYTAEVWFPTLAFRMFSSSQRPASMWDHLSNGYREHILGYSRPELEGDHTLLSDLWWGMYAVWLHDVVLCIIMALRPSKSKDADFHLDMIYTLKLSLPWTKHPFYSLKRRTGTKKSYRMQMWGGGGGGRLFQTGSLSIHVSGIIIISL